MTTKKIISTSFFLFALVMGSSGIAHAKQASDSPSLLQTALTVNGSGPFAGSFDTLIAAVLAADPAIVDVLASKGQHTVFAPTDDAFSRLGIDAQTVGDLDQDLLTTILLYHVVHGRLDAEEVLASDQLNTLLKGKSGFVEQAGGVLIDNAGGSSAIIVTDVEASNGIIHVIDNVLIPQ